MKNSQPNFHQLSLWFFQNRYLFLKLFKNIHLSAIRVVIITFLSLAQSDAASWCFLEWSKLKIQSFISRFCYYFSYFISLESPSVLSSSCSWNNLLFSWRRTCNILNSSMFSTFSKIYCQSFWNSWSRVIASKWIMVVHSFFLFASLHNDSKEVPQVK